MLRTRTADLHFTVDLVDQGVRMPLVLALEHQSTLDMRLPCRAHVYVGELWSRFIREHPNLTTVPAILPILLAQHPARNTPRQLAQIVSLTPRLHRLLGRTVELELRVDDLSGSVLEDALARPGPLALVEITRALLHAYRNPGALSRDRMELLAPQFDIVLGQNPPLGNNDITALWRYVIAVFEPDSSLRDIIVHSVSKKARQMYTTIADQLHAEGHAAGRTEGHAAGLTEGRAVGRAAALLDVFRHRGLPISPSVRGRVLATRDESVLRQWLARALTVASADELFEGPAGC